MSLLENKYGPNQTLRKTHFESGRAYLAQRRYKSALKEFQKSIDSDVPVEMEDYPAIWEVRYLKGVTHQQLETEQDLAVQEFLLAIQENSSDRTLLLDRVHGLLNKENAYLVKDWVVKDWLNNTSINHFTDQERVEIFCLIGRINLYSGSFKEANSWFRKILKIDKENERAYEGIAELNRFQNNKSALLYFKKAKKFAKSRNNRVAEICVKLIDAQIYFGRVGEARKELNEIQSCNTNTNTIINQMQLELFNLQCDLAENKLEYIQKEAEQLLNKLNDLPKDYNNEKTHFEVQITIAKAKFYLLKHSYEAALESLDHAYKLDDSNSFILLLKAQVLIEGQIDNDEGKNLFLLIYDDIEQDIQYYIEKVEKNRSKDGNVMVAMAYFKLLIEQNIDDLEKQVNEFESLEFTKNLNNKGPDRFPELCFLLFKGDLFSKKKEYDKSCLNFYNAAKRFYWQRNYSESIKHYEKVHNIINEHIVVFSKVVELDVSFKHFYFEFSNTIYLDSAIEVPPYRSREKLFKAYEIWNKAKDKVIEGPNDYWHFVLIAFILVDQAEFVKDNPELKNWEALLYCERWTQYMKSNHSLTSAAKIYRELGLHYNSDFLIDQALALDDRNAWTIEEKALALLNIGRFDDSIEFVNKTKNTLETGTQNKDQELPEYIMAWYAFAEIGRQNFKNALQIINKFQRKEGVLDAWIYAMILRCYWMSIGKVDSITIKDAKKAASKIYDLKEKPQFRRSFLIVADACAILNKYQEANDYLNKTMNLYGMTKYFYKEGAFILLKEGNVKKAKEFFNNYISWETRPSQVNEIINMVEVLFNLSSSEKQIGDRELHRILYNKNDGWIKELEKRFQFIEKTGNNQLLELMTEIEKNDFTEGSTPWIACKAGISRLNFENAKLLNTLESFKNATDEYMELIKYDAVFPEVHKAIESVDNEIIKIAREHIKNREFALAEIDLENIHSRNNSTHIKYFALKIITIAYSSDKTKIEENINESLPILKSSDLFSVFKSELIENIANEKVFWLIYDSLENILRKRENADTELIQNLIHELLGFWTKYHRSDKSSQMLPVVTPIAVEIGKDLIFNGPEEDWIFLKKYIPEMRDKIAGSTGVKVPGIRIRGNETDLASNEYIIFTDEVPIITGKIELESRYCPVSKEKLLDIGLADSALVEAWNPLTGDDGYWINPQYWNLLEEKEYPLWAEPIHYLLYHLEYVLRGNLDMYFGMQEVENVLEQWQEDPENNDIIQKKLSEKESKLYLRWILRALIRERVSINSATDILKTIRGLKIKRNNFDVDLRKIRLALRKYLPGNQINAKLIRLSEDFEARVKPWIVNDDNGLFFAIPPEETQELLTDVRDLITSNKMDSVLVVQNNYIRPFVRNLVEIEFPDLMVISQEELLS